MEELPPTNNPLGPAIYRAVSKELESSPYNVLEIGAFNGGGTKELASGFPNTWIYVIDPFVEDGCTKHITEVETGEMMETQYANFFRNVSGLSNVLLFNQTSVDFAKDRKEPDDSLIEALSIGWVIIDGAHDYENVTNDYELAMTMIGDKPNCGIIFDDLDLQDVGRAYQEFWEKYKDKISHIGEVVSNSVMVKIN